MKIFVGIVSILIVGISLECKADEIAQAKEILDQAIQVIDRANIMYYEKAKALKLIAVTQARVDDLQGALNTAGTMPVIEDKLRAYGEIAEARAELGDTRGMREALDAMSSEKYNPLKEEAKIEILHRIGVSQAKSGNMKVAQEAFTLMASMPTDAKNHKYNVFIADVLEEIAMAQVRGKDFIAALQTVEAMKKHGYARDRMGRVLSRIAATQASTGDIKGALETAAMLPPLKNRTEIVGALVRVGAMEEARNLVKNEQKAAEAIENQPAKGIALTYLARVQAMAGDVQTALQTAAGLSGEPKSPSMGSQRDDALWGIADAQAQAKDKKGALETAAKIQSTRTKEASFRSIALLLAEARDVKGALEALDLIQTPYYRAEAVTEVAKYPAVVADISVVLPIVNTIKDQGSRTNALLMVAEVLAKTGDVKRALEIAPIIETQPSRANLLNLIGIAQVRAGDGESALRTVERYGDKSIICREIARIQAQGGDTKSALSMNVLCTRPYEKTFALVGVAEGIWKRGNR